jgi:hypothetical protein
MLGNCDFRENRPSKSLTVHSCYPSVVHFIEIRGYRVERSAVQEVSTATMVRSKGSAFLVGVNQILSSLYYENK